MRMFFVLESPFFRPLVFDAGSVSSGVELQGSRVCFRAATYYHRHSMLGTVAID